MYVHSACTVHPCVEIRISSRLSSSISVPYLALLRQHFCELADPLSKSFPPMARAVCTPRGRNPQRIMVHGGGHVICNWGTYVIRRLACSAIGPGLVPSSFRRIAASNSATFVPIGPPVRALCSKMLGQAYRQTPHPSQPFHRRPNEHFLMLKHPIPDHTWVFMKC